MGTVIYETPEGEKSMNATEIAYDEYTNSWVIDLGRGGSGNIPHVGTNIQKLVIPESRVYRVELTKSETFERISTETDQG